MNVPMMHNVRAELLQIIPSGAAISGVEQPAQLQHKIDPAKVATMSMSMSMSDLHALMRAMTTLVAVTNGLAGVDSDNAGRVLDDLAYFLQDIADAIGEAAGRVQLRPDDCGAAEQRAWLVMMHQASCAGDDFSGSATVAAQQARAVELAHDQADREHCLRGVK